MLREFSSEYRIGCQFEGIVDRGNGGGKVTCGCLGDSLGHEDGERLRILRSLRTARCAVFRAVSGFR
jgi:hypothetical protein